MTRYVAWLTRLLDGHCDSDGSESRIALIVRRVGKNAQTCPNHDCRHSTLGSRPLDVRPTSVPGQARVRVWATGLGCGAR